jgi:hypothetical protein
MTAKRGLREFTVFHMGNDPDMECGRTVQAHDAAEAAEMALEHW